MAQARKLVVFHFSPRYSGQAERIYREAQDAFRGREEGSGVVRPT